MGSFQECDFHNTNVYKMMKHLGIELGGGVIPRFGFMYASAARTCQKCESVHASTKWLGAESSISVAPEFCPNAAIFFELMFDGQTVPHTSATHYS